MFHPKYDYAVSVSEDKTLKVWDYTNRIIIENYKRDTDRFWIVACHPTLNYLAAGHDSGFIVFKLEPDRPAFIRLTANTVAMAAKNEMAIHDLAAGKSTTMCSVPAPPDRGAFNNYPKFMNFNQFDSSSKAFILTYKDCVVPDLNCFKVCVFPASGPTTSKEPRYGDLGQAVFVSKDKICTFKNAEVFLCAL